MSGNVTIKTIKRAVIFLPVRDSPSFMNITTLTKKSLWLSYSLIMFLLAAMSETKYGYPYPPQGPYQGPPVAAPPQYYAAQPPPKNHPERGFLEGCLAALCCCCLLDECCCDPTIICDW
ncbi:hypothetical protein K1719_007861 [Acacia pycnantha]|nr:hypothetical protein K1719_007861 [Acacia pycnantha]